MAITVYFATNRVVSGPVEDPGSYTADMTPPDDPRAMTFGTAFIEDSNLGNDTTGAVRSIQDVSNGHFSDSASADLSDPGRNLLIFIHGFKNTFEDAITRAAYNQQWLAASGLPGTEMTVIAFCWPSLGQLLEFPRLTGAYEADQKMAGRSGPHVMRFMAAMEPILRAARGAGRTSALLVHSMGTYALAAAVESWFAHGNGADPLFDCAVLAASDEQSDTFQLPSPTRLTGLPDLADRVAICFNDEDEVLGISRLVNGVSRLGQRGPAFAVSRARFVLTDCTAFTDYDRGLMSSHQYYRRSPSARAAIAGVIGGS